MRRILCINDGATNFSLTERLKATEDLNFTEIYIMEYIKVTNENIEKEHICCAISNNNDIQVSSKKAWL